MAGSFAHSAGESGKPHDLETHLRDTARRAREFAEGMRTDRGGDRVAEVACWAGLLHDLGKYRAQFQEYLEGRLAKGDETQHSVFGAAAARNLMLPLPIRFAINGHHAGLHNLESLKQALHPQVPGLVQEADRLVGLLRAAIEPDWPQVLGEVLAPTRNRTGHTIFATHEEFLVRMLFSCLVDADFLDTERHFQGRERSPIALDPAALFERVDVHVRGLTDPKGDPTLMTARRVIYEGCVAAADAGHGLFSLTTPTGGGKTLASLAFALKHADKHDMCRVIAVLPFLSIIEQNAKVYRDVLGDEVVVEHHSAVERPRWVGGDSEPRERSSAELAAENWDAPVVVTTSVQFLESLFARSPSRCRKLHNLARAVVILDEVQTLPHHLLGPTIDVIRELSEHYGASFVFCSATQPGFARSSGLRDGFQKDEVTPILPHPSALFRDLVRVRFELPAVTEEKPWDWPALAGRLAGHRQVLAIVNLRRHAVELYNEVLRQIPADEQEGTFHLSSAMCPAHRLDVLGDRRAPQPGSIYHALAEGLPCRVVSTQVVEAGVDIDFPVVYRALAPLDAIIQSAGRCNREGKLDAAGDVPGGLVVVFRPADPKAGNRPYSKESMSITGSVLQKIAEDPARLADDFALYAEYHDQLLQWKPSDSARRLPNGQIDTTIQEDRQALNFEKVAEKAKAIEDDGQAVAVPYKGGGSLLARLRGKPRLSRDDRRDLQRFLVNLRETDVTALGGLLTPIADDAGPRELDPSAYDPKIGIKVGERPPEDFALF